MSYGPGYAHVGDDSPFFTRLLAARRNSTSNSHSAALLGLKPNCQFEKRVHEIPTPFFSVLVLAVAADLPRSDSARPIYSHDVFVRAIFNTPVWLQAGYIDII